MICLGVESTAHTFSIGLVSDEGEILGLSTDTYTPEEGGLTPQKVIEHHYDCYQRILDSALKEAKVSLREIDLVAFSQGPGLGGVLAIGATIARTLSLKLQIPLIGVNHCIGHVEIGRCLCSVEDPITLYVSGGNTIVSAFQTGRYQIFGETLDIAIGNMLDKVARLMDIPHPGGPVLEKKAKKGKKFVTLPYVVKGMDLSYSGLFSSVRRKLRKIQSHKTYTEDDIIYSLQETAFAMLTEVCERALAHTGKREVLLTGGVAANKRLQEMIRYIALEHGASFHVVPRKVAGDNGAMIAWMGIIKFNAQGPMDIEETTVRSKWRMDEIEAVWRDLDLKEQLPLKNQFDKSDYQTDREKSKSRPMINTQDEILSQLRLEQGKVIRKGAEASLVETKWFERDVIIKYRHKKEYRHPQIDQILRSERTLLESRALIHLQKQGVPVPTVFEVDPSLCTITMAEIKGITIKDALLNMDQEKSGKVFELIGKNVAKLHKENRIHGDITTSNIIFTHKDNIFFIDFGLTDHSTNKEDFSVDIHLFKRVLVSTHGSQYKHLFNSFSKGYKKELGKKGKEILSYISKIEKRGRYISKDERN